MDKQIPMLSFTRTILLMLTLCLYGLGMTAIGVAAVEFTRSLLEAAFGDTPSFWRAAWVSLANPVCWVFTWYAGKFWHQSIAWVIPQIYKR